LGVSTLLPNGISDSQIGAIVGQQDCDLLDVWSKIILRILHERTYLVVEACHQVEGEVLPLISRVLSERSDHWQGGAFRKFGEWHLLPEDDGRNDGKNIGVGCEPPQRIHCRTR